MINEGILISASVIACSVNLTMLMKNLANFLDSLLQAQNVEFGIRVQSKSFPKL